MSPQDLRQLSTLLDEALELPPGRHEPWLAGLTGDAARLGPMLRQLLEQHAAGETVELLRTPPAFTAAGEPVSGSDFAAGDVVGPYRLLRVLGRGGMGEVWLAERIDGQLNRRIALKLPTLGVRRSVLVQRFARERDILAALAHPHIARLYDAGLADDGQPYLALEYVEGRPITQHCAERNLDVAARIALLRQVMDAVQYAHANLVVHRDLKPSNVLVTESGGAMLLDFGIAKLLADEQRPVGETELTALGGRALTLAYAAPEQVLGEPISIATDVYALGVLTYELLGGRLPFDLAASASQQLAQRDVDPPRPSQCADAPVARMPRSERVDLDTITLKALKRQPLDRYRTVAAMADDLDRCLAGQPVLARPDSAWYRARKFVGRNKASVASGALAAVALVAAVAVSSWQASIAGREARTAQAVEGFLSDVFTANSSQQADPETARRTTARELLDRGARRIDTSLADAPEARARVLETLARMNGDLTLYESSLQLHRQRVALLRTLHSSDSPRLASALSELGLMSIQASNPEDAQRAFDEAAAIFDRRQDNASFERGLLEGRIAYLRLQQRKPEALSHARRAVAILRRHPPSSDLVSALKRQAYLASETGEIDASVDAIREGLQIAVALNERGEPLVAGLYQELGRLQTMKSELRAAGESMRHAYQHALRREGPNSIQTLNMAVDLGQHLFESGEYLKALDVFRPAAEAAERRIAGGDRSWVPVLAVAYVGATRVNVGAIEPGVGDLRRMLDAREALAANPPVHTYLLRLLAEATTQRGDYATAEALLDEADAIVSRAGMQGDTREANAGALSRLLLAMARGDAPAIKRYSAALGVDEPRPNESVDGTARRMIRAAEARGAARDMDAALSAATQTLESIAASPNRDQHGDRESRAALVAGKAHLSAGRSAEAVPLLRRAVALTQGRRDRATSPVVADALVALARALVDTGFRDEAVQLTAEARAIHARHAQLAEHFRAPLVALEAHLGSTAVADSRRSQR